MIVQSRQENDGTVVLTVVVDALIASRAAQFREEVDRAMVAATGRVEVDCSRLDFIDSSGVGALLHMVKLLPVGRPPVRLTGVGPKVLANLELMCVHRIFDLVPST
ncbi:MAG: STAS domain-containing protein [Verrucomicrobia bacterium]|nr:STAS domain-containing protein [Verrucomicrobiota bacterium]